MMKCSTPPKKRNSAPSSNGSVEKALDAQTLYKHFPALGNDKLERLAAAMSVVRFNRGEHIPIEQQSTDVFLLLKGALAVTWEHDGRHPLLVTLLAPGEIFGVASLMPEIARGLKGYAFSNSQVATIKLAKLLEILLGVDLPAFKSAIEMTVGWSTETLMRYVRTSRLSPRDRLVIALIEMGAKFGVRDSRGLILNLPITQKDLSNLLGVSRQKVNANLGQLVRLGAVINLSRQIVLVPDKLFALIGDVGDSYRGSRGKHSAPQSYEAARFPGRETMHL